MTEHVQHKPISLADPKILRRALLDSFRKLDPRTMIKNPGATTCTT
jgi:high-affinity K+ transport system ATPase subunit B